MKYYNNIKLNNMNYGGIMLKIRILIFCVVLFSSNFLYAQSTSATFEATQDPTAPFRLFRTTNRWTFIKLDTITGRMWQIQYDTEGDNRNTVVLNSQDLATGKERIPGRFTLYSTQNIWNFILLDQIDGNLWQVQWSQERRNRWILPIE